MKTKTLTRIGFITNNALRQVLVSVFSMVIPFLVIHYNSKEIWGSFVSLLLFSLLALQVINWGNKEYLLRQFSMAPNAILANYSINLATRFPLVIGAGIVALWCFPTAFGFWIFLWLLGRFLSHASESLVIYEKEFNASIAIELIGFAGFCVGLILLKLNLFSLLVLYSCYQFIKGLGYFILFRKYFAFGKLAFDTRYYTIAFPFFLLSILGFFASKVDVYLIESLGDKILISDYQIINNLLVFTMSLSAFIYAPFIKNIYRNNGEMIRKIRQLLAFAGLIIVPVSLWAISAILHFYIKLEFAISFYLIAACYVFPSFVYGIEIVNLFRLKKEKTVVFILGVGVVVNATLSSIFLFLGYGIFGALLGSATTQLLLMLIFLKFSTAGKLISQKKERKFYSKLIHPNSLCFDIGANVGKKTRLLLSLNANVIAFEPQSSCADLLNKIKLQYHFFRMYPFAVGARNETKQLFLANHPEVATISEDFIDFFSTDKIYWNDKETVTVRSLDSLIGEFGLPDFCKIDTEGYEFEILSNLSHKIPLIEFEFTGRFIEDTIKIITILDKGGARFNYTLNENLKFILKYWISGDEMKIILKSLPKNRLHGNIFVQSK